MHCVLASQRKTPYQCRNPSMRKTRTIRLLEPPGERKWTDGPVYTAAIADRAMTEYRIVVRTEEDRDISVLFLICKYFVSGQL